MKKILVLFTVLFFLLSYIGVDVKAQDRAARIKAEIHRHGEAIRRLKEELHSLGGDQGRPEMPYEEGYKKEYGEKVPGLPAPPGRRVKKPPPPKKYKGLSPKVKGRHPKKLKHPRKGLRKVPGKPRRGRGPGLKAAPGKGKGLRKATEKARGKGKGRGPGLKAAPGKAKGRKR